MNKNLLINGEFNIAQRGTSFDSTTTPKNDDDTYLLDRWILLSDGNDVADVSQVLDAPQGSATAQKSVVQTVNKKFGFLQIIENANCQNIISDVASLSFQAKTGVNAIRNIRAAILTWGGAKDTVTSDVVSAWNAEGTDPTLVADWTYENIPLDIPLTPNWQKFTVPDISIGTLDTKNVGVFIWVDDTNAVASDEMYLGQIQLEKGSAVSDYEHRQIGNELACALRYYEQGNVYLYQARPTAVVPIGIAVNFKVRKRSAPIFALVASSWVGNKVSVGPVILGTSLSSTIIEEDGMVTEVTGDGSTIAQYSGKFEYTADSEL